MKVSLPGLRFDRRPPEAFRLGGDLDCRNGRESIGFSQPVGDGSLYLVAVCDPDGVNELGF